MKKRILSFIVALCLIVSLVPTVALATNEVTISATKNEVKVGETFEVSMAIPQNSDMLAYTASFKYFFDNTVFEVVSFSAPTIGDKAADASNSSSDFISCTYTGVNGGNTLDFSSGVTITATFKAKDGAAVGSYDFTVDVANTFASNLDGTDFYTEYALFTVSSGLKTTVTVVEDTTGEGGGSEGGSGEGNEGGDPDPGEDEGGGNTPPEINVTAGYSAAVSASTTTAAQKETVTVDLLVGADEASAGFSSALIVVKYDTTKLTYKGIVCNQSAADMSTGDDDRGDVAVTAVDESGTITIKDYGTHIDAATNGTAVYTLTFETKDGGAANVTLESAYFSTLSRAETLDMVKATVEDANKTATINVKHKVTVNDETHEFTIDPENVADGGTVTITAKNEYYNYTLEASNGTLSGNGPWTISDVTDDVEITVVKAEGEPVDVTIKIVDKNGDPVEDENNNDITEGARYGENYTYKFPENVTAGTETGVTYTYKGTTIGDQVPSTGVTAATDAVTIDGTAITGDIVITIQKDITDATQVNVSVVGDFTEDEVEFEAIVAKGENAVLALTKNPLYDYKVTATVGGSEVTPTESGNTYTVKADGAVVFTIKKTVNVDDAVVSQYVQLDGTVMWLVKMTKIDGKTYTYNDVKLYDAYSTDVVLVVAEKLEDVTAALVEGLKIVDGSAQELTYEDDINGSGAVDLNDAQLAWNMYNAVYSDFTTNVTMEKFLLADAAGGHDGKINMLDIAYFAGKAQ